MNAVTKMDALQSRRGRRWVSKTDLVTYIRCPYAFWLLYRGRIDREALVSPFSRRLVDDGIAFQEHVVAKASPARGSLSKLMSGSVPILETPLFENHELEIYGRPDGVDPDRGALLPIEIKSHKGVERIDRLELAFYWLLLAPLRRRAVKPQGVLFLRHDGRVVRMKIEIRESDLATVAQLLEEVRTARKNGVRPRACDCDVCTTVAEEEVEIATTRNADLTLLHGLGRFKASALERSGVKNYKTLMKRDADELAAKLRPRLDVSANQIRAWQHHAHAFVKNQPVLFGDEPPMPESFIAIDLEYRPGSMGPLWLIGGCVVEKSKRVQFGFWSETPRAEKAGLSEFASIVDRHPLPPIASWNGDSADLPHLRHACQRAGLGSLFEVFRSRHVDLLRRTIKSVRLPITSFGLKEIASYFRIGRTSPIASGLQALILFEQYRQSRDRRHRRALRRDLEAYNREDVSMFVAVVGKLRDIQKG